MGRILRWINKKISLRGCCGQERLQSAGVFPARFCSWSRRIWLSLHIGCFPCAHRLLERSYWSSALFYIAVRSLMFLSLGHLSSRCLVMRFLAWWLTSIRSITQYRQGMRPWRPFCSICHHCLSFLAAGSSNIAVRWKAISYHLWLLWPVFFSAWPRGTLAI